MGSIIFLIATITLIVLYIGWLIWTGPDGAPYVAMEMDVVERLLEIADVGEKDIVYDLGSGDGRIPIMAALQYRAGAVGVELDFLRYIYSVFRTKMLRIGREVRFIHKNIFDTNLSEATVVTMYLLQRTNERLAGKLVKELRPGSRIATAGFDIPSWKPILVDEKNPTPYGPLYLYKIGVSNTGTNKN